MRCVEYFAAQSSSRASAWYSWVYGASVWVHNQTVCGAALLLVPVLELDDDIVDLQR